MPSAAPLVDARLLRTISRRAHDPVAIAEIWRRVGRDADRFGVTRPSYERVRTLVHRVRARAHAARLPIVVLALPVALPPAPRRRRHLGRAAWQVVQRLRR